MNEKDTVISMEDYKKSREAGCCNIAHSAPPPTPGQMRRMIEASPPLRVRVQVKAPQPKPWYHWYTEQR